MRSKQTKQIHKALRFEAVRKSLLSQQKFDQVLKTYQTQKIFLPDENTGKFWDDIFAQEPGVFPMEDWRIHKIAELIDCGKSILNLGVGRGDLETLLLKKCGKLKYLGTDIALQTITHLQKKFPKLKFQVADLFGLDPEKYQFDQILLLEVLEHIKPKETLKVLRHVYQLTKPGGYFYVSVPVNEGLEYMLPKNPNSHMRLYSEELLKFEVESLGFTVRSVYRASAFAKHFAFKHALNSVLHLWESNNLLLVCKKAVE